MHKHRIILKNFDLENGKISFSKLRELQDKLTALAEGVVLSLVEGRSKSGPGQKPKWLQELLDFKISGLQSGSTILDIEALAISETYQGKQLGIFDEPEAEQLMNESAFGLASYAYSKAITEPESSGLLDKNVLQKIVDFNKIMDNNQSEIGLISDGNSRVKSVSIKLESLKEVSVTEQKTRNSVKTTITGTLDVMRHKKDQMEIVTSGEQRIRAYPAKNLKIKGVKDFFGEHVRVTGMAHFKMDGKLRHIEILDIQAAGVEQTTVEELTLPIFENLDLKQLAKKQNWEGFNKQKFRQTIQDMEIEESPEDLLELLKD